jgi:hypothetical protein
MKSQFALSNSLYRPSYEEQLRAQELWIQGLEARLDIDCLFIPEDPEFTISMEPSLIALRREFARLKARLDSDDVEGITSTSYLVGQSLTIGSWSGEKDMVMAASLLGILDNPNSVHIHNLCGVQDLGSRAIGFLRGEERLTESTCWEIRGELGRDFETVKILMGIEARISRFMNVDIREASFPNREAVDNYWVLENPGQLISHAIDRIISLSADEMPEGIAIIPCHCCCYVEEEYLYANSEQAPISKEEWDYLVFIARGRSEEKFRKRVMKIMDCLRVRQINEGNRLLKARCQNLNQSKNIIIIDKELQPVGIPVPVEQ